MGHSVSPKEADVIRCLCCALVSQQPAGVSGSHAHARTTHPGPSADEDDNGSLLTPRYIHMQHAPLRCRGRM